MTPMFNAPVSTLVRRPVVKVDIATPVRDAVSLLRDAASRCLCVIDDGHLVGIFTDRDMVERCLTPSLPPDTPLRYVMESPVVSISAEASIAEALHLMDEERIRHLPLVDADGQLVGLIRARDLLEYIAECLPELVLNLPPEPVEGWQKREGGGHG